MKSRKFLKNNKYCPCCFPKDSSFELSEYGIFSSFFLQRVFSSSYSNPIKIFLCNACKSKFFDVYLSNKELSRLYDGYRGDKYFKQRNYFEPWYTRKLNDGIGHEKEFSIRRKELIHALELANVKNQFDYVLDHGGDKGQMLKIEKNEHR